MNIRKTITALFLAGILINLPLMGADYKQVSDGNFESSISKGVVVVDFYGDKCPPCQKFGPVFEQVAREMSGTAAFVKANIDQAKSSAKKYKVSSIPTVIVFKDGKEIKRKTGGGDAQTFKNFVKSVAK